MTERFPAIPDLTACLENLLAQVPLGRATTCGDLADALGNRIAARWVGHFTLHHRHNADCICHRIVRAGGALGGYIGGSTADKIRRLAAEGIETIGGRVDLDRFGFRAFASDRPLERLRKIQEAIRSKIRLRPRRRIPKLVGGVDAAYPSPDVGTAAYALVETETGRLVWSATVRRRVVFPFISTYLSFREIPLYLELLDEVRSAGRLAEVVLVDGTGVLHPRRAGIASHLGVAASLTTIGVIKKLLCGRVDLRGMAPGESRPVVLDDRLVGIALRPGTGPFFGEKTILANRRLTENMDLSPSSPSFRPIFISPGHRIDFASSETLVRRLLFGRRLPAPLDWADRLSRGKENGEYRVAVVQQ
jgi:deoxyribonuclease V